MKTLIPFLALFLVLGCEDNETDNTEDEITYIDSTVTIQLSVFPDIGYASITDFEFNINIIEKGDTVLDSTSYSIRFDWNGDGDFDTSWSDSLYSFYNFSVTGKQKTIVQVKDSLENIGYDSVFVYPTTLHQITENNSGSYQTDIDWSTDGSNRIAFDWQGDEGGGHEIYYVGFDDGDIVQVTNSGNHYFPKWSPDGSKIAMKSGDDKLKIFELNNGSIEQLVSDVNITYNWSNDGEHIYYIKNFDLFRYSFAENDTELLFENVWRFDISPDGESIILQYEETLDIYSLTTFDLIQSIQLPYSNIGFRIEYHPSGDFICLDFDYNNNAIAILELTTEKYFYVSIEEFEYVQWSDFSEDGSKLAFEAQVKNSDRRSEIWAVDFPLDLD